MATAISSPLTTYTWGIVGDQLGIFRSNTSSGEWEAIDESTSEAILLHYYGEPDSIESKDDYPDVDNTLHEAFVDFLKHKIFSDLADKTVTKENPTQEDIVLGREYRALSREHKRIYDDKVRHYGRNKIDKVGGPRMVRSVPLK
jgi:hypothetical protein